MEVEIISRERIKPSSPTPEQHKIHKLSLLDQLAPSLHPPIVLYYSNNQNSSFPETSQLLKQSLAETLTLFYPLAGKIKDNLATECSNDDGAYYIEAKANYQLSEFLEKPDILLIRQFIPLYNSLVDLGSYLVIIQVTVFECGGLAITSCISHVLADAFTVISFIKCWAAAARNATGEEGYLCPNFDSSSIFPQIDSDSMDFRAPQELFFPFFKSGRCATRRFVFNAHAIYALKEKSKSSSVPNPSRVETLSAFIWKRTMKAFEKKNRVNRSSFITHSVNLRSRAETKFSENSMGNLYLSVPAFCKSKEIDLQELVYQIREAIKKIDSDFVKSMQGNGGFAKLCDLVKETSKEISNLARLNGDHGVDYMAFSSLCNFGMYGIDFGWGKPMWVHSTVSSDSENCRFFNYVLLFDTRSSNGVEVWANIDAEVMEILENDEIILEFAALDPSPHQLANCLQVV